MVRWIPPRWSGGRVTRRMALRGLTLIELVVVVAIAAILVSTGVPSFVHALASYRVSTQLNGWIGDLQFARAEAIKRGQTVTLCVSADGLTCAAGSTAWHAGWIVFADANGNATVNAGERVLRVQTALAGGDTFNADNGVDAVTFNRDGFAIGLPAAAVTLALHDPTNDAGRTRCVALSTVGRTTVEHAGTGNCR